MLYPNVLDTYYQFSWKTESEIPFPYCYRILVRHWDSGTLITPNDSDDHWYQSDVPVEDTPIAEGTTLTGGINIVTLLNRSEYKSGLFAIYAHLYDSDNDRLTEEEQRQFMYIFKDGKKPPNLP